MHPIKIRVPSYRRKRFGKIEDVKKHTKTYRYHKQQKFKIAKPIKEVSERILQGMAKDYAYTLLESKKYNTKSSLGKNAMKTAIGGMLMANGADPVIANKIADEVVDELNS